MILKIWDDAEKQWYMFDDLSEVDFGKTVDCPEQTVRDIGAALVLTSGKDKDKFQVVRAYCKNPEDGQHLPHVFIFNTFAYICNDEGKTLEKIGFSYR